MSEKTPCSASNKSLFYVFLLLALLPSACSHISPTQSSTSTAESISEQERASSSTPKESAPAGTKITSPNPSCTPTELPGTHTWQAEPVIIEMARVDTTSLPGPQQYQPLLILYGNGLLIKQICEDSDCHYGQVQLVQESLCRLVNAVHLTGFLDADPWAFSVPGSTGACILFNIQLDRMNTAKIDNFDSWMDNPDWYDEILPCTNCYEAPVFDPAFEALYRLLSTYEDEAFESFQADRLAVWISPAILLGNPSTWDASLPALEGLIERAICPNEPNQRTALILEGTTARSVSEFISSLETELPVFRENEKHWLVQTRWLLPHEMPQTCERPPGFYPPIMEEAIIWSCAPEMGAIPTPTPTITPTPSMTPTPIR